MSKMHLIFDFDGTITTQDTIGQLARAGIAAQNHRRGVDLQPAWAALLRHYLDDYSAYTARFTPAEADRNLEQEKKFLGGLKDVERASLRRVGESSIFTGLAGAAMRKIGADAVGSGDVQLRPGFGRLVQAARDKGWPVSVVSVNWSTDFIRGVVDGVLGEGDVVVANGTAEDGTIEGPEENGGELLVCSPDKLRAMEAIRKGPTVYFGDSTTDLECLLDSERGVVLAEGERETSLLRTLRRVGFEVPRVNAANEAKIVWAKTFDEVLESM